MAAASPAGKAPALLFLVYLGLFYSQLAGRYPVLAPLHPELLVAAALLLLVLPRVGDTELFVGTRFGRFAFILPLYLLLTIPFAYVRTTALFMSLEFLKFFFVLPAVLVAVGDEAQFRRALAVYLAMIALVFVQPFLLSLQGEGFMYNNHMYRLAGVTTYFAHPNQLGMVTAANLPLFVAFFRGADSLGKRLLFAALIAIALRVVMLTYSRTSYLGVLALGGYYLLTSRRKVVGLGLLAVALAILWAAAPQQTRDRFLTFRATARVVENGRAAITEGESNALSSMASRWELVQSTFETFRENPVLGVGLGCSGSYSGRRGGSWFPPHNTYLQILAELGLVGALLFVLIVQGTIRNLREAKRVLRSLGEERSLLFQCADGLLASYAVFLVVATFGIELYSNNWWLVGGLSVVLLRICRARQREAGAAAPPLPAAAAP